MSEWEEEPLGSIARFTSGGTPSKRKPQYWNGDVPWISGASLRGPRLRFSDRNVTEAAVGNGTRIAPKGSVLLLVRGMALHKEIRVGQAMRALAFNQDVKCLIPRAGVNATFLLYALEGRRRELLGTVQASGHGTGVLATDRLEAMHLAIPGSPTQRRIVAIVSAIDDLIENNRRRVEVLEEMARALYREWFVKYRYPGHSDVPLVHSALGPIPEEWQVGRVDSLILLQRGFDLPLKVRECGPIPVVGASGVQGSHSAAKATGPGVVTGRSGTIGVVNYVPGDFWPLNTSLWVREFRLATPRYAYFLLEGLDLKRAASGSAVPSLDRNVVHGLPVVCPPASLLEVWDTRVAGMFEAVEALRAQSTRLSAIRDLLLPKLVTGQIDVSTLDLDALVSTGSTGESAAA